LDLFVNDAGSTETGMSWAVHPSQVNLRWRGQLVCYAALVFFCL
jgi:hypothetical protein